MNQQIDRTDADHALLFSAASSEIDLAGECLETSHIQFDLLINLDV